ncbi:hypothetical protein Esti_002105 [Eimeria stiedai]
MDLSSDAVPAFHLPLSVDEAHSRQQTENLRSFPRAYTCPTYSTACQQQQLQQQQQQRAAAAGDVASYLSYAFYVNDATRNPYRGPPEIDSLTAGVYGQLLVSVECMLRRSSAQRQQQQLDLQQLQQHGASSPKSKARGTQTQESRKRTVLLRPSRCVTSRQQQQQQ